MIVKTTRSATSFCSSQLPTRYSSNASSKFAYQPCQSREDGDGYLKRNTKPVLNPSTFAAGIGVVPPKMELLTVVSEP